MLVEFCITFVKTLFFNLCTSFIFIKSKKYQNIDSKNRIFIILLNIIMGLAYAALYNFLQQQNINAAITNIICYTIYMLIFSMFFDTKFLEKMILIILSIAFSFFSMIVSTAINFIIIKLISTTIFLINMENNSIMEYVSIGIIQYVLLNLFFKINRFKDGFAFLKKDICNNRDALGMIIGIITIIMCVIYAINKNKWIWTILIIGIGFLVLVMLYWIKTSITKYYKERMKDRTVELQDEQLKEKDEIINNLKLELSNVLEINHKYNRRLSAMERAVANLGDKLSFNEEFANEYSDVLDSLKDLSKEYKQEFENFNTLPKTNIFSVDNLLEYMKIETLKKNIEFELQVNGNVKEMIEKHIPKNKLETLLGDHITDAIIAINSSDNSSRKIKVIIGKEKEFYEVCILDTGIEFEIETLLKLGLERITTHNDSGGTGIGFMTTFETLKECKASLIIEEYNKQESEYTKSIIIRFDGNNNYNINTYRTEEIRVQNKDNRINIEESKRS